MNSIEILIKKPQMCENQSILCVINILGVLDMKPLPIQNIGLPKLSASVAVTR